MEEKMTDDEFTGDLKALLRPDIEYQPEEAYQLIYNTFIDKMEGKCD
jgi:hypothetical protein